MGRPKQVIRRIARPLQIPETLNARVDAYLFSEVEQKVPYGKFSEFVCQALEEKLQRIAQEVVNAPNAG